MRFLLLDGSSVSQLSTQSYHSLVFSLQIIMENSDNAQIHLSSASLEILTRTRIIRYTSHSDFFCTAYIRLSAIDNPYQLSILKHALSTIASIFIPPPDLLTAPTSYIVTRRCMWASKAVIFPGRKHLCGSLVSVPCGFSGFW